MLPLSDRPRDRTMGPPAVSRSQERRGHWPIGPVATAPRVTDTALAKGSSPKARLAIVRGTPWRLPRGRPL